jgi:hypothetical protein
MKSHKIANNSTTPDTREQEEKKEEVRGNRRVRERERMKSNQGFGILII